MQPTIRQFSLQDLWSRSQLHTLSFLSTSTVKLPAFLRLCEDNPCFSYSLTNNATLRP